MGYDGELVKLSNENAKKASLMRVPSALQDVLTIDDPADASVVVWHGEDVNLRLMPILKTSSLARESPHDLHGA